MCQQLLGTCSNDFSNAQLAEGDTFIYIHVCITGGNEWNSWTSGDLHTIADNC